MSRDALVARVRAWIDAAPEPFEELALDIHRWQVAHDPQLAALVERPVQAWTEIPAVPVSLFKHLPVGTVDPDEPHVAFRTSGTTGSGRGTHRMRDTALYDHGSLLWARRCVPDLPADVVALLTDAPDSSLGHMVRLFGRATWHQGADGLDREGLDARVRAARGPLFVAATAFALAEWLDGDVPRLPDGSVAMVTGGFKGRHHRLSDEELYAEAARLGGRLVTEYGMTELSSQLWGTPGAPYRPPPWLRVLAVDPATGRPRPRGETGQLRFVDLCNVDSTLAIDTLDAGVVHPDGSVTLHGRLEGAPDRGCSLTAEEAWSRRGGR